LIARPSLRDSSFAKNGAPLFKYYWDMLHSYPAKTWATRPRKKKKKKEEEERCKQDKKFCQK
jgi:hypothetical protein